MRYKFRLIIILSSLAISQDLDWTNSGFENGNIDWPVFPSDFNASVVEEFSYEGSKSMKIIPYTDTESD